MKTIMWLGFVLGALSVGGEVVYVKRGQSATINCGGTATTKVEWRKGDEFLIDIDVKRGRDRKGTTPLARRSKLKQEKNLEIRNVEEADAGLYTCYVDQRPHEHRLNVISVSVVLNAAVDLQLGGEATLSCEVKGLDPTPTVEWQRPNGTPETKQKVHLKHVTSSDVGPWTCKISHDGTEYSEKFDLKVKEPVRETTRSPPSGSVESKSPCRNCTAGQRNKTKEKSWGSILGLKLWMWIAIGVGCLVLVVLVVSVIVVARKIKRRRRKARKLKNMRQPLKAKQYCQCNRPAAAAAPPQGRQRGKPSALPQQQR